MDFASFASFASFAFVRQSVRFIQVESHTGCERDILLIRGLRERERDPPLGIATIELT